MRLYPFLVVAATILSASVEARLTLDGLTSDKHQPQRFLQPGPEAMGQLLYADSLNNFVENTWKSMGFSKLKYYLLRGIRVGKWESFDQICGRNLLHINDLLNSKRLKWWVVYMMRNTKTVKKKKKAVTAMGELLHARYGVSETLTELEKATHVPDMEYVALLLREGVMDYLVQLKKTDKQMWALLRLDEKLHDPNLLSLPLFYWWVYYMGKIEKGGAEEIVTSLRTKLETIAPSAETALLTVTDMVKKAKESKVAEVQIFGESLWDYMLSKGLVKEQKKRAPNDF